jgi:type VI secretion system Hcp family effector
MAFNAYLVITEQEMPQKIKGESTSAPEAGITKKDGAIELQDYGFGVTMPVTPSRSDGGGATVGRANFDVFTATKGIDTATPYLFQYCCKGTAVPSIVLHLYRAGEGTDSGVVKYAMVVFQWCVITKVGISGSGEELPKESLEFNYGKCEYVYQETDHNTGKKTDRALDRFGWSTIQNKQDFPLQNFNNFKPDDAKKVT